MLDKLVQLIINFLYLFKFWYVMEPWEQGYSFHFGAPGRTLGPEDGWLGSGFHIIWPGSITRVRYYDIWEDSAELIPVDLTTKDGHTVKVGGVFRYRIRADKAWEFLVTLGDESTALPDFLSMAVARVVADIDKSDLFNSSFDSEDRVLDEGRRQLNRYGFKIIDFYWNYKVAPSRTIRVMTD